MQSILIVDDLESIHEMLEAVIQPIGYQTSIATDGEMALQKVREQSFDIILTDINMEPMDGLSLLSEIKKADPSALVIVMSGFADVENATRALKLGAFDFLTKPFKVDQLMNAIRRASDTRKKRLESDSTRFTQNCISLSGDSEDAKTFNERLNRASKLPTPLLITGDSGTQKPKLVAWIQAKSNMASGPFVTIDARASDPEELKTLLFAEEGAPSQTIESAQGGFLHIANIDSVPLDQQAALGGLIRDMKGETRVICTSNEDIEQLVEQGKFEDALYFRIANNTFKVPSLRDRPEDINAISLSYFAQNQLPFNSLSDQAIALLQGYRWPGNYTELQEVLAAAAASAEGRTIGEGDLPERLRDISAWPNLEEFLTEQSERYKQAVLKAIQGDREKATEILGISQDEL